MQSLFACVLSVMSHLYKIDLHFVLFLNKDLHFLLPKSALLTKLALQLFSFFEAIFDTSVLVLAFLAFGLGTLDIGGKLVGQALVLLGQPGLFGLGLLQLGRDAADLGVQLFLGLGDVLQLAVTVLGLGLGVADFLLELLDVLLGLGGVGGGLFVHFVGLDFGLDSGITEIGDLGLQVDLDGSQILELGKDIGIHLRRGCQLQLGLQLGDGFLKKSKFHNFYFAKGKSRCRALTCRD